MTKPERDKQVADEYWKLRMENERLREVLLETRNASAALCRLIVSEAPEIMAKLPHEYDGFGKRADEALAAIKEALA